MIEFALAAVLMGGNPQVCSGLDSGKVDVAGSHVLVTVEAPVGFLIDGYCVKAGSVQQGNGPHYVTLEYPVGTLTFGHPSGKDVSHYSLSWSPIVEPPVVEPPVKPEPVVEVVRDRAVDCVAGVWRIFEHTTTTDWVLDGTVWVPGAPSTVSTVVSEPLTEGEIEQLCPIPTEPVPPVDVVPEVKTPEVLPETGLTPAASWLLILATGAVALGASVLWTLREPRRRGTNR